jgi:hypothetical protein
MESFITDNKIPSNKASLLPPLKLSMKDYRFKSKPGASKKLELYFKLRTSSKIVINHPIECLHPSGPSNNKNPVLGPTAADVVMSSNPPQKSSQTNGLKFSRLIEVPRNKNPNDNSFLNKTYKTNQILHSKVRRFSNGTIAKNEKKKNNVLYRPDYYV